MKSSKFAGALVGAALLAGPAAAETTIEVQYPYGVLFDETFKIIGQEFEKDNPGIKIKFRAPYESYEDGSQKVLKEHITRRTPDITFQGLNRQRILVEKGIAQSLEPFIAEEADFAKEGYHKAMLDLGTFGGKVHGLPFAVSLPIAYYNMDILKKAGWTKPLPTTWDGVIEVCKAIKASNQPGVETMFWGWNITGNWFWQALNWSRSNTMLDATETKVNFGNDAGKESMAVFAKLVRECNMPNYSVKEAVAPFAGGKVGMLFWSTSRLAKIGQQSKGVFDLKTGPFPGVASGGGLPAGGNAGMMLATGERAKAAWKFLKFATSGRGAAVVAQTTGYMPPNKKANDVYLKDFYAKHPNHKAAVDQLPMLREWYAFPGKNGLKITKVIFDAMQSVASKDRAGEPDKVLGDMVGDVQKLLPKSGS